MSERFAVRLTRYECVEHGPGHIAFDGFREVHRCVAGDPPCLREAVEVEYVRLDEVRAALKAASRPSENDDGPRASGGARQTP